MRNAWESKLCNAWEYQQYRKASGYSSIKATLRCSSATCFAHKYLNASLRSFVRGLQGRSQALEVHRNDWEYPQYDEEYKLRNAWKYQQYRKASGFSSIKAALQCSSATRLVHKLLKASLCSFVHDCKGEVKLLMRRAMIGNISHARLWSTQYRKASGYSGIKAALRCSSATRLAHKHLNASLHSFVHDCKGEVKNLKRYAIIGNIRYIII